MNAPAPPDEARRLQALHRYDILDTPPDAAFDDITELAAQSLRMPIALVSFVDANRQWFKSAHGLEIRETPRDVAFCAHAILTPLRGLEVPDARQDLRFKNNPLVTGPPLVRFYAAVPLLSADGFAIGTLSVVDRVPRQLGPPQWQVLRVLARQVQAQLELRRQTRSLEDKARLKEESEARLRAGYELLLEQLREAGREKTRLLQAAEEAGAALSAALAGEQASGRALQESEARFRGLWASAQDTVLILDEHSTITYTNDAAATTFGWTPAELIGQDVGVLQPERLRGAHHAGMSRYLQTAERRVNWKSTETTARHRDGHEIAVEVSFSEFTVGGRRMFAGFLRDIDGRKRAEAERARLADFLERSVNEVLVADPTSLRLQYANDAARRNLVLSQAQLEGLTVADITPDADRADLIERLKGVIEGRDSQASFKTRHLRAGADPYVALMNAQLVGPVHERVLLLTGLDISDLDAAERARESLQRQLRQVQKLESLGTLAGGIAHDFNNMVGSMLGNVSLAREDLPDGHPARLSIEQIERAALRARALVGQILAFSRQQPPDLTVQPLGPVIQSTARLLQALLPANVRLGLELPDEELFARADTVQLERVLMNLGTNAIYACAVDGGDITIGLERRSVSDTRSPRDGLDKSAGMPAALDSPDHACLWVQDTGMGIDAATRERLFEPFFTTKPVGQGTGLGLAVVHGIVSAHGGTITVQSAPGAGARFEMCLPTTDRPQPRPPTAQTLVDDASIPRGQGEWVLYLDDDEVMLLMVERLLDRAGYRVVTANDPHGALQSLASKAELPACVVTDFSMPGMSGLEFVQQLHTLRSGVPVVLMTGDVSETVLQAAQAGGITEVVAKQDAVDALPRAVARALNRFANGPLDT